MRQSCSQDKMLPVSYAVSHLQKMRGETVGKMNKERGGEGRDGVKERRDAFGKPPQCVKHSTAHLHSRK